MKALAMLWIGLSAVSAFADNGIEGTWKFESEQCASGAPSAGFGLDISGQAKGTIVIANGQLRTNYSATMIYNAAKADQLIKTLKDNIKTLEADHSNNPITPDTLNTLRSMLAKVTNLKAGVSCSYNVVAPYTLAGKIIHSGALTSKQSDCPDDRDYRDDEKRAHDSEFELSGNTLILTNVEAETDIDSSCPAGDRVITILSRSTEK